MNVRRTGFYTSIAAIGILFLSLTLHADSPREGSEKPPMGPKGTKQPADERITVAEARERARLMHQIYSSTLETMHHHYFRREHPVLPARALEDVFDEIDEKLKIKSRWIAVNTPPMSVGHEAKTDFEKKAAAEIASGKAEFDRVEDGYYLRAGAIPLGAGCVSCHTKFFTKPAKGPRFAGLVISIPVKDK